MCDNKSLVLLDMVSFGDTLKNSLTDGFMALPLLLMGFEFLFGTLTSNTGLLYLLVGQFLIVPMLGYWSNETNWLGLWGTNKPKFIIVAISVIAVFVLINNKVYSIVEDYAEQQIKEDAKNTGLKDSLGLWWIPSAFGIIGSFFTGRVGSNRAASFLRYPPGQVTGSPECSLLPLKEGDISSGWNHPSLWTIHMVFLGAFLFSNAMAVYNLPVPNITEDPKTNPSEGEEGVQQRKERLNSRVANRKRIAIFIMVMILFVFGGFLAIRFFKSSCEDMSAGFLTLWPLLMIAWVGVSWYDIVYKRCGVNPPDVLGIVTGIIPAELMDTPMVCIGGDTNFS